MPDWKRENSGEYEMERADEYGGKERKADDLVVTTRAGVTYSNDQVIGYDLVSLLRGGVFFVSSSTFFKCYSLTQALIIMAITFVVSFACFVMVEIEIFTVGDGSMMTVASAVGLIYTYFGGLTALLFVYFVFTSLGGYNTVKNDHFGLLSGGMVNLIILTCSWLPSKEKEFMDFKERIVRWGLAAFALTAWVASGNLSRSEAVGRAVEFDFLTGSEAEAMKESDFHPASPVMWMVPAYEKMIKSDFKMDEVAHIVLQLKAGVCSTLNDVSSYTQAPLPLIHLMSALVKLQLLLQALKSGVDLSVVFFSTTNTKYIQASFILLSTFVTPIFYQGLLEFVIQIANPFGNDWIDLPTPHLREGLRQYLQMFVEGKNIPLPVITLDKKQYKELKKKQKRDSILTAVVDRIRSPDDPVVLEVKVKTNSEKTQNSENGSGQ
jgi:hypothetical protein